MSQFLAGFSLFAMFDCAWQRNATALFLWTIAFSINVLTAAVVVKK